MAKQGNCNFPLPSLPLRSIKEGGRCTQDSLLVSSCDANHSNISNIEKYFQYILRYFKYIREVAGALKTPCWFPHVMPTTQIFTEWEL